MSTNSTVGDNWARNYSYQAASLHRPRSVEQLQEIVGSARQIRALGTRHCFNDIADSAQLVSIAELPATIEVSGDTVTVSAGMRYGDVAAELHTRGWALHNLASLPHISIAGAIATGTHGSGDSNGTLSAAVAGLEFVTASGSLLSLRRGEPDFAGAVVSLGALGVVTRVTLDIQPTFDVRQDLYENLPYAALLENLDAVTSSAYSVSLFTNWQSDVFDIVWLKSRMDAAIPPAELFGATPQQVDRHMLPDQPAVNTTEQGGVPGPWSDRLAHFRLGFTPSNGDELQSEYLVPRHNAVAAIEAVRTLGSRIAPLLLVTEIRTMAADDLWLSGAYRTDAVGIHFTWKPLAEDVTALLPDIEALLLPLGARPHWGKVFTAGVDALEPLYPQLPAFRSLAERLDPTGTFRNPYLEKHLGLPLR